MSESDTPANEPETANGEDSAATDAELGEELPSEELDRGEFEDLSFDEILNADKQIKSQRKTIHIAVPHPEDPEEITGVATFEYRMLSEEEKDEAEDNAVSIETTRNKEEVKTDSGALKATLIRYGVTGGPDGFKCNNERFARQLPGYIKDPLASAIEDFTEMEGETREGFR